MVENGAGGTGVVNTPGSKVFHYYLSPDFEQVNTNPRKISAGEGVGLAWDRKADVRDDFLEWLGGNALGPFMHFRRNNNLRVYLKQRFDGNLFEVTSDLFERTEKEESADKVIIVYNRIVEIRHIPQESSHAISQTLADVLAVRGYKQLEEDKKDVPKTVYELSHSVFNTQLLELARNRFR